MGCFKNVTRAIFFTIVIVGFMAFGGQDWLRYQFNNFIHPSKDTILERAQKIGDFSRINKEFEIEKAAGILGYNAVLAEHKASGQKMMVVDTGKKTILTQEDIKSENAEEIIKSAINKIKYQSAAVEEFRITERGVMKSYGKDVPYVRFTAKIKRFPIGELGGIISVAQDSSGNDRILISANEKSRYSQLITNEFFKEIK